ncbi:MAG TPA: hypothetical protein VIY90_00875 [Steroidobacteraceae bacterium]
MNPDPDNAIQAALEQRITRVLAGTAQFKAPQSLQAQVWSGIEGAAKAPWWRRRVLEWPVLAQLAFAATGVMAAAAMVLGRPTTPAKLHAVITHPVAVLQQPAADLHATMNVLAVFRRLTDTIAGSLPVDVWYGGIALCALAYVALFYLIVFGYRLLRPSLASR